MHVLSRDTNQRLSNLENCGKMENISRNHWATNASLPALELHGIFDDRCDSDSGDDEDAAFF